MEEVLYENGNITHRQSFEIAKKYSAIKYYKTGEIKIKKYNDSIGRYRMYYKSGKLLYEISRQGPMMYGRGKYESGNLKCKIFGPPDNTFKEHHHNFANLIAITMYDTANKCTEDDVWCEGKKGYYEYSRNQCLDYAIIWFPDGKKKAEFSQVWAPRVKDRYRWVEWDKEGNEIECKRSRQGPLKYSDKMDSYRTDKGYPLLSYNC
jgi:hypothetical protein